MPAGKFSEDVIDFNVTSLVDDFLNFHYIIYCCSRGKKGFLSFFFYFSILEISLLFLISFLFYSFNCSFYCYFCFVKFLCRPFFLSSPVLLRFLCIPLQCLIKLQLRAGWCRGWEWKAGGRAVGRFSSYRVAAVVCNIQLEESR